MGFISYKNLKEAFDGSKHPDVCNGRKTEQEAITEFLEVYDMHHNTFNDYNKNDRVSRDEFVEFYRTLSANYDDDLSFINMVKGVWGVKFVEPAAHERNFAGGNDTAQNSRDRYQKANNRGTPFGTSQQNPKEQWKSSKDADFGNATKYGQMMQ